MTDPKPHITAKVQAAPEADPGPPRVILLGKSIRTALDARAAAKPTGQPSKSRHGQRPRAAVTSRHGKSL